jgi:hypothetical protein
MARDCRGENAIEVISEKREGERERKRKRERERIPGAIEITIQWMIHRAPGSLVNHIAQRHASHATTHTRNVPCCTRTCAHAHVYARGYLAGSWGGKGKAFRLKLCPPKVGSRFRRADQTVGSDVSDVGANDEEEDGGGM